MSEKKDKVVVHGDVYAIDLRERVFRRLAMPWNTVSFESRWGMKLCQRFNVVQCSECGSYSRVKRVHDTAECGNCGLFFTPAEVYV